MPRKPQPQRRQSKPRRKSDPEIRIFSLEEIEVLVSFCRTDYSIVSIRDSDIPGDCYSFFGEHQDNYRDIIAEVFDDIESPSETHRMVQPAQVERILGWARGRSRIAVHCTAGISRSSAVAYLIACSKMPASKAIGVLDVREHYPNDLVLYHGIKLLGDYSIFLEYMAWRRKAEKLWRQNFDLQSAEANRTQNVPDPVI